jgi:hypothetical protein
MVPFTRSSQVSDTAQTLGEVLAPNPLVVGSYAPLPSCRKVAFPASLTLSFFLGAMVLSCLGLILGFSHYLDPFLFVSAILTLSLKPPDACTLSGDPGARTVPEDELLYEQKMITYCAS